MKKYFWLLTSLLLLQACGPKEQFAANKANKETSISSSLLTTTRLCSAKTHIKAPVDVLILLDNSSSTNVFDSTAKSRLTNMINAFALDDNFDYHIMVAPLVGSTANAVLFANYPQDLNSSAQAKLRPTSAISTLSFPVQTGGEFGITRSYDLIQANRGNGMDSVFRSGSHTIIAVLTNGNDTQCSDQLGYNCQLSNKSFYNSAINQLTCLGHNTPYNGGNCGGISTLNAETFRFVSLSPAYDNESQRLSCKVGTRGTFYHHASNEIFTNGLASRIYTDSYPLEGKYNDARDFCTSDDIFSHIRSSIKDVVLKHKYNRWPVADSGANIDTSSIRVKLVGPNNNIIRELTNQTGVTSPSSGFSYDKDCTLSNDSNGCNTRYYPSNGEPFIGHLIKLHGADHLEFPNCLSVEYYAPTETYKYVYLPYGTPQVSTIELYIDLIKVEQSTTNGWEYIGNACASSLTDGKILNLPVSGACGPMLKLNGNAVFQSKQGTNVNVRIDYISQ